MCKRSKKKSGEKSKACWFWYVSDLLHSWEQPKIRAWSMYGIWIQFLSKTMFFWQHLNSEIIHWADKERRNYFWMENNFACETYWTKYSPFFFLAFKCNWWLCSLKYFSVDKAAWEMLCDKGKCSDCGNDGSGKWDGGRGLHLLVNFRWTLSGSITVGRIWLPFTSFICKNFVMDFYSSFEPDVAGLQTFMWAMFYFRIHLYL